MNIGPVLAVLNKIDAVAPGLHRLARSYGYNPTLPCIAAANPTKQTVDVGPAFYRATPEEQKHALAHELGHMLGFSQPDLVENFPVGEFFLRDQEVARRKKLAEESDGLSWWLEHELLAEAVAHACGMTVPDLSIVDWSATDTDTTHLLLCAMRTERNQQDA